MQPRWLKIIVAYKDANHLSTGLALALHLEPLCDLVYFARYTNVPPRLELRVLTACSRATLRRVIGAYRPTGVAPLKITFPDDAPGSTAHALACNVIKILALENSLTVERLTDIVHWMFNMAGFSYVQEAMGSALHCFSALRNIPGMTNSPVFTQLPVTKANGPKRKSR